MRHARLAIATAVAIGASGAARAGTNDLLLGIDSKVIYNENGQTNIQPPGADAVLVLDISNPAAPRIRASLPLVNSLLGPPTNLEITPDGRLGLVANSVNSVADGSTWKSVPDDKLYVIDLEAEPPKLLDTVTVGKQPSGLDIARAGNLVLIANRAGKSISVLAIDGKTVKVVGEVPLGNEAAGVAITPDGKRAFAVMNAVNKVAVLEIDGQKVTYDKAMDIPAAFNPYNIAVTPDGKYAIASSTGAGGFNGDALTTIDTSGPHPHVVALATFGGGAEGFAIAPNGKYALTPLLLGTGLKHSDPAYTTQGQAVLMSIGPDGALTAASRQPLGALPEGVAFSPDSQYAYVGNFSDQNLQIFRVQGADLVPQGAPIKLPGQPASLRGPAH